MLHINGLFPYLSPFFADTHEKNGFFLPNSFVLQKINFHVFTI